MRGSILRGYRNIVAHGYAAVYQDTRGRYASEGEDRVYADDAADGYDTLDWIASEPWCNRCDRHVRFLGRRHKDVRGRIATTPNLRAFFAQVGGSSITTTSSTKAMRSRWNGCGCGREKHSRDCRAHTVTPRCADLVSASRTWTKAAAGANAAIRDSRPRATRIRRFSRAKTGCACRSRVIRTFRRGSPFSTRSSAIPRRTHPGATQFPQHDRDSRISRNHLVRHIPDERHRGVQRYQDASATSCCGSAPTIITSSTRRISGRAIRISNGSTTG